MNDISDQAKRGFALSQPGDPLGVSCDKDGPSVGPIRLLAKSAAGLAPRPVEDLDMIMSAVFRQPTSCEGLIPGLMAVARAIEAGDMARAIFATQYLRLPGLSDEQARLAQAAEISLDVLGKARFDHEKHPRWPAKAPDSEGGRFRPKQGAIDGGTTSQEQPIRAELTQKVQRRVARQMVRTLLKNLLNWRRLARVATEIGSNVIPGADIIGDAALIAEIRDIATEYEELSTAADTAMDFMNKGPYTLEDLQGSSENLNFASFDDFKKSDIEKRFGPAGDGFEWHHIVEQGGKEVAGIPGIQSTNNIIRLPKLLHEAITAEYSSIFGDSGKTLRSNLLGESIGQKRGTGIQVLKDLGILKR